jgi:DNA-binding MarR family transcriptional regulator
MQNLKRHPNAEENIIRGMTAYLEHTKDKSLKDFDIRLYPNRLNAISYIEYCNNKHGVSIKELERALKISYPSAFKNLNILEEKGYLKSKKEPLKNKTIFSLTPKGKRILIKLGLAD